MREVDPLLRLRFPGKHVRCLTSPEGQWRYVEYMRRAFVLATAALMACGTDPLPQEPPPAVDPASLSVSLTGPDHLLMGRTTRLEVTASRRSGLPVESYGKVSFRSTLPRALAVDSTGLVTVADSGSGHVIASVEFEGRTLSDSVRIVGVEPGFRLHISQPGHRHHYIVPQTGPVAVTVLNRHGDTIPSPIPVSVRSTDTSVFRIDSTGTISAIAPGKVHIIASATTPYGEVADSLEMMAVCTGAIQMKLVERPTLPFRVGMSFPMEASFLICKESIEIRPPTSWRSENPTIVTIDSVNRKVRAVAPGTATVIVTAQHDGGAIDFYIPLTVEP